jgi:hypothetical protein
MQLLGEANWWLPSWLDRLLPNLDIEGAAGLPAPQMRTLDHPSVIDDEPDADDETDRVLIDA